MRRASMNAVRRWATVPTLALAVASGPAAGTALAQRDDGAGHAGPAAPTSETVELIVHQEPGRDDPPAAVTAAPQATVERSIPQLDAHVVAVPAVAADRLAAQLADAHGVARVEPDGRAAVRTTGTAGTVGLAATTSQTETADAVIPNDPRWSDQWGLEHIEAPSAWKTTTGAEDVTVAVLDTGVDPDHPDLAANLTTGRDFTLAGGGGTDTDDHDDPPAGAQAGHGTMSAGVLAAATDNAEGVAGTCWTCTILPVRVMEPDGTGALSRIAEGIVWAVDQGADVINLSLGSRDDLRVMREAVAYAVEHDVALVAAAGNLAGETPIYPGAYDAVVGVAASTQDDTRSSQSSYGSWVELTAPGCNPSTRPDDAYTSTPFCGTSASAPLVSGVMALALASDTEVTPWQAQAAVTETAEPVGDWVAHGRLDGAAALDALADVEAASAPPLPHNGGDNLAGTEPGPALERVAGTDRFDTAARLSQARFETGTARVYLATGQAFADALTAGAAAGAVDGPVLLAARDRVPQPTRDELARLQPDEVVVVGGTGVLTEAVREAAGDAADAPTRRVAGPDRFATATELAADVFPDGAPVAYVATGEGFADALAGVPAAVAEGGPVLLTAGDRLPDVTQEALAQLTPTRIVVLGGPDAVSASVGAELSELAGDGGVQRLAGSDRFATAARVAEAVFEPQPPTVHLATGVDFADALAGGPAAATVDSPLLLVTQQALPQATADELRRLQPQANVTLGGSDVVSSEVEAAAGEASAGR